LNKQYDENLASSFVAMSQMLNILNHEPDVWFQGGDEDKTNIEAMVLARDEAKKAKDYGKADAIRDELLAQGIALEDSAEGTRWKKV
jgi:cysteinyl-tRNA synthetase